ncbi:MAG: c-type cytochrome domain-containing protein, partial [Verrucomicrobiota bacterium]
MTFELHSRYKTTLWAAFCLSIAFPANAEVDFARDIQPILNAKCTECHGGVKAAGDVSFVYEEKVINFEGDSGYPVVKPGDVEESELYFRITTDDEDEQMPPAKDHAPLSKSEVALIREWIVGGA